MLLTILTVSLLLILTWFDFKYRLIPLWLYLALGAVLVVSGVLKLSVISYLGYFSINAIIIGLLMAGVFFWFWIKGQHPAGILDNYLGRGDLLFMLVTGLYFSPLLFVSFQVISIMSLLAVYGIFIVFRGDRNYPIPMAGGQALLLAVFEIVKTGLPVGIQYRDQFFMHYLTGIL